MRYYLDSDTLFIRGAFRAASTGISGGIRSVTTLFNHTVPGDWGHTGPEKEIELVAAAAGTGQEVLGLLTAVPISTLCVLQYDFITVFVTVGIRQEPAGEIGAGTINIIAYSSEGMEDSALLETIMIATEAKTEALLAGGRVSGTPTDAVIAACEDRIRHRYAGRITEPGRRVRDAVLKGVPEALRRHETPSPQREPAFLSTAGSKAGTGWNGLPITAPITPAILPASVATSATARSIRARMKNSANGQRVLQTAGSGTARAAPCSMSRPLRIT